MIPYIVFYFIVFLISFKIKKGKWNFWDFLLWGILVGFSSVRYGIGSDYLGYKNMYINSYASSQIATSRTGWGFSQLMILFNDKWNLDYQYLVAFCAIVSLTCVYIFMKNCSNNPGRSILIYIALGAYASSFNGYRQVMSISILLLAFLLYQKKKIIPAIMLAIAAFLIHSISIIPIIVYYVLYKSRKIEIKPMYVVIISILCFALYNQIFSFFINISDSYSGYATYDSTPGIGTYLTVLVYYFIYFFFLAKNKKKFDDNTALYFNLASIGVCFMSLQLHNWLFNRIVETFTIFMPIVLSEYYDHIKTDNKKIVSLVFHILLFIYFLVYINSFGEVVPYQTIFNIN